MNIYKFEFPYGIGIVCAKNRDEAINIMYKGDGYNEEMSAGEYGFSIDDILEDDEPFLVDTTKSHIIGFHCG